MESLACRLRRRTSFFLSIGYKLESEDVEM
jgi:hypothetical protein